MRIEALIQGGEKSCVDLEWCWRKDCLSQTNQGLAQILLQVALSTKIPLPPSAELKWLFFPDKSQNLLIPVELSALTMPQGSAGGPSRIRTSFGSPPHPTNPSLDGEGCWEDVTPGKAGSCLAFLLGITGRGRRDSAGGCSSRCGSIMSRVWDYLG